MTHPDGYQKNAFARKNGGVNRGWLQCYIDVICRKIRGRLPNPVGSRLRELLLRSDTGAEELEVLEKVVIGLPRVAEALVPLGLEEKERALAAVERAYQKAATECGYSPSQAEGWAATVMADLRAEIDKRNVPNI